MKSTRSSSCSDPRGRPASHRELRASPDFVQCGGVFVGNDERYSEKVLPLFDEIGIEYDVWDPERLQKRLPGIDTGDHAPPKRPEDDAFWEDASNQITSAVHTPIAGYITDAQLATHNLQRAAEARLGSL